MLLEHGCDLFHVLSNMDRNSKIAKSAPAYPSRIAAYDLEE
jgi:hypothetical protein